MTDTLSVTLVLRLNKKGVLNYFYCLKCWQLHCTKSHLQQSKLHENLVVAIKMRLSTFKLQAAAEDSAHAGVVQAFEKVVIIE